MLDINKNGKLDPEEKALEDILAEKASAKDPKRDRVVPWVMIGLGILIVLLIISLIFLAV